MKNHFLRLIAMVAMVATMSGQVSANMGYAEGTWALAVRGGIVPAKFSKDVGFTVTTTGLGLPIPSDPISDINTATVFQKTIYRSYHRLQNMPYSVGGDVGYFFCDNIEVFANFDIVHSCAKTVKYRVFVDDTDGGTNLDNPVNVSWKTRDINTFAGYLGMRQYFCPLSCLMPFVGAKMGIKGQTSCDGSESFTAIYTDGTAAQNFDRASQKHCAIFTGGLQLGVDWIISDCYAVTFMSEILGTKGSLFKSGKQSHSPDIGTFQLYTNVSRNPSSIMTFPLTLGVRVRL